MGFGMPVKIVHILQNFLQAGKAGYSLSKTKSETAPLRTCSGRKLPGAKAGGSPKNTRSGYLAVYVGIERKRFLISTTYLSHRLIKDLLKQSEEEFGFCYSGGITMPCESVFFEYLLCIIGTDDPVARTSDLEELYECYSSESSESS